MICRLEAMPTWYEPSVDPDESPVYGTARGRLRARLASPLAARARGRRHRELFARTGVTPGMRILDVGCGTLGLRGLEPGLDITGVDLVARPGYPGPFVLADATRHLPFEDGAFDLAYVSSVVEHIAPSQRAAFAAEVTRVARGLYVQTPAYSFPIEPHSLLPGAHWLPPALRRPYWRLGAQGGWEDVHLLRRAEVVALFGEPVVAERFAGLVKSWVALRPVA
jgi:SAM-dependent methyltransferase